MTEQLTIIIGYRDRDLQRIERCLASLERQSLSDFRVVFVDYGSCSATAARAKQVVQRYSFCTYIYNDTRGYAWNRSHALNCGLRVARSPLVMTTDIDMIFPHDFLEILLAQAGVDKVIYCPAEFLPKDFADWDDVESYRGRFRRATKGALGACQLAPTATVTEIRGFDEYYRYWGREDRDIHERLLACGLQPVWIEEDTTLFHQWHPLQSNRAVGYMPDSVWNRMQLHYLEMRGEVQRNDEHWGRILTADQRPVYQHLDFARHRLRSDESILLLDAQPDDVRSIGKLTNLVRDLAPGHALAVNHANFPRSTKGSNSLLHYTNYVMYRLGLNLRLDYGRNHLHSFLIDLIDQKRDRIGDYYLDFPALDGISILIWDK